MTKNNEISELPWDGYKNISMTYEFYSHMKKACNNYPKLKEENEKLEKLAEEYKKSIDTLSDMVNRVEAEKAELLGGLDSIAFQCNPHLNAGISLEIIEREAKQLLNKYIEGDDDR